MSSIGLGVIGTGDRAIGYLQKTFAAFRKEGAACVRAVADVNPVRAEAGRRDLGAERAFTDHAALLESPGVDAVFVMTPDYTHAPIVQAALAAGKHVYCEKPMATTLEDCNAIVAAAKTSRGLFFAGHNVRFGAPGLTVQRLIAEGRIGPVRMVWARRFVQGAKYWHRWHRDARCSGGLLVHKGCHYMDQMNWHSRSRPRAVAAFGGLDVYRARPGAPCRCRDCTEHCPHYLDLAASARHTEYFLNAEHADGYIRDQCVYAPGATVFDNAVVSVQYANGVRGTYMECHFAPITDLETEVGVVGDDGLILRSRTADNVFEIRLEKPGRKTAERIPHDTPPYPGDEYALRTFLDCVRTGRAPESGYQAGWDSAVIGIAAQKAAAEGRLVSILPEEGLLRAV